MAAQLPFHTITGNGETSVFLLHGAYGDGRYFNDLAAHLATQGYRVVVWDCPGYRESPAVDPATIENFSQAAVQLVEAVGTKTNVLLGHSLGALIGPNATNRTDAIHGLVLSAGAAGFATRTPEEQEIYIKERIEPIENGMSIADYARPQLFRMMSDDASGPLVDHVVNVVLSMEAQTFVDSIRAITLYDSRPELKAVAKPTLLIAGREDPTCTPEGMEKMHGMIKGSEFHIIEGAGHYGFAEKPDKYKSVLLGWLQTQFPAR